ncbi:Oidioi.mRNA.OKI2018_I69.PAR.g9525.t1.cds [Oikopleura dioica]|uniref:Oidioi.mRNA.OKI2018_I69.PAR.g9525.t1.cds n=1 Tax=Oikopleura dioica TaxID=34765 RepID=A0ABN7RQA8_OIKDI|nr:Oidioi.mRNA.OKI2018_I69.PAR.g9525.t1.cds [Oikopleura dioica]
MGSMNSTFFANSTALAVQRGCMLPDVEFCGEQLFRMVELNLIDNIGEAFGFNTTSFNLSDPFLSANFTEPNMTCCFDDFCNCDFCQQVGLTLPPTTLPVFTTQATTTSPVTLPPPVLSGQKAHYISILFLLKIFATY